MTVAFRLSDWDTPLPASPPRGHGRFHVPGGTPAHYWCLHPHGPWAEMFRWNGMRTTDDTRGLRSRLWAAAFVGLDPLRIGFDDATEHGLGPDELVSDDHGACQGLARRLAAAGVTAIVVPSAALPGTHNLILFGELVRTDWQAPVESRAFDPSFEVPAAVAAEDANGQRELVRAVRHLGDAHASF